MRVLLSAAVLAGLTFVSTPQKAHAGPDPFIGELMVFAGNFCPRGWAEANGQLLSISQNSALFSLLGTNFGGDGRTTFGLPNLTGKTPIGSDGSSVGKAAGSLEYGDNGSEHGTLTMMHCIALVGIYPSRN